LKAEFSKFYTGIIFNVKISINRWAKFLKSFFVRHLRLVQDFFTIRRSGLFNHTYYQNANPGSKLAKRSPILHYLISGSQKGKDPSPEFSTSYYLHQYPDVQKSGINPLVHYVLFGKNEGRIIHPIESIKYQGYSDWIKKYDSLTLDDYDLIHSHIASFEKLPRISISLVIPKDFKNFEWVKRSIFSVIFQIYPHWQLNIFCDEEHNSKLEPILMEFGKRTHKIAAAYFNTNQDLVQLMNEAIKSAQGEFFIHLLPGTVLREHSLYLIANEINHFPEAEVIYTDEDQLNEQGERSWPFFKPDWNPDLIFSKNLLSNIAAFKIDSLRSIGGMPSGHIKDIDLSLALRISEVIPGSRIRHIPHVGAHRLYQKDQQDTKETHFQTIKAHFDSLEKNITLTQTDSPYWRISYSIPTPAPLVSILIPTKNQYDLVKNCLESIRQKTHYSNYEVLIINNQTEKSESNSAFENIENEFNAHLLDYNHPFNYSAINNFATKHANGDIFLFLNDDIEVIAPDWLDEMVSHAVRKEIGAVGAMLYFPNNAIQHAGIVLHPDRIAGHAFYLQARGSHGQNDRARLVQNYSAVTGACMAIERIKLQQVGGFDEENLPVAYNDVDLCLKLMLAGYRNLWTPYAELYHYESVTRGLDNTEEKLNRLRMEARYMLNKWGSFIMNDPAYHPNLKSYPFFSLAEPPRATKPWLAHNSNN